jgi:hypothetical protein
MADYFLFKYLRTRDNIGCDEGTFAMLGYDETRVLQLKVGAFDGNHADAEIGSELADGWYLRPGRPFADGDLLFDLVHNLLVERPAGLRENDAGRSCVHNGYSEYIQHVDLVNRKKQNWLHDSELEVEEWP